MRFLCVAPLRDPRRHDARVAGRKRAQLISRVESNVRLLEQEWQDLPTDTSHGGWIVDEAAWCRTGNYVVYALEIVVPDDECRGENVSALEERLSERAKLFLAERTERAADDIPWVARYALREAGDADIPHWLPANVRDVDITAVAAGDGGRTVTLRLGWGNGEVVGWDALPRIAKRELVRGIIDAQHIWSDTDHIGDANEACFDRVIENLDRPRRRAVREITRESAENQIALSLHLRLYDELLLGVQGVRRASGMTLLEAWGYQRAVERLEARIVDLAAHVSNLRARIGSRHQTAVQVTLLALGCLVVIDTTLNFIGTAYSGAAAEPPGGRIGLFELLRSADSDVMVLGAIVLTGALVVVFGRRRS